MEIVIKVKGEQAREDGYYWVKDQDGEWEIAEWCGRYHSWECHGSEYSYDDSYFREIGKTRITRQ